MSRDLYSPNMGESGASVCQVKQLPCHSAPLLRLQACGHQTHNLSGLPHKPCLSDPFPVASSGTALALRHRVSGATAATCNSPNCAASRPGQEGGAAGWDSYRGKVLVTGGGGFFGFRLGKELASEGMTVILLDVNKPPWDIPDGAIFFQSDIRDYATLYRLCEGVDCIFHTASYGMSGPEQLKKEQVESVNVGGTNNVIDVCKERGIPRLVYTSTINVVFAGKPIVDGDEASVPCVPCNLHIDHYSRTKAVAEQMVLSANGSSVRGGGTLETCVLRPSGIYGPGERRHLPRVMMNVERRLFSFRFGDPDARMNWVHVDNLVLAHKLAAEALSKKKGCVASGQTYFINDGVSVNVFEWLTPLFEKLGYSRPSINLPVPLIYSAAILLEYLHVILSPVIKVPLLFTRSEVRNITVSHTFKIDKARRELGYFPKPYSLADSVEHYLNSRQCRAPPLPVNLSSIRKLTEWGPPLMLMALLVVLLIFYGILS